MKAIFYRNFQFEKWYYLAYLILFILTCITSFGISIKGIEILRFTPAIFIGIVSMHASSLGEFLSKQNNTILFNSLPVSKIEIVKAHYLYNLMLTGISFLMVMFIAVIYKDTIFVQAAIFIVGTNLLTISTIYPYHVHLNSLKFIAWVLILMLAFFGMYYFSIYNNRAYPFHEMFGWKIFLYCTPSIFSVLTVILWIRKFTKAIKRAKLDELTIYGVRKSK
ncbi:ABC-2 transporter permease [Mammaliicoccus sp. Dog046]|uniref:ABC-2 transporter permease n=1 Tax=Mammaliicoccus sp. Dog046 TaxID=3034233 RepID=UPI002B25D158|nr:ABC-2 transporter permease [Mammaliicoccus sp. Dog046]WQK86181.1 ABC-2 transporter permease [Mammaliicoccus sp. Dog046]